MNQEKTRMTSLKMETRTIRRVFGQVSLALCSVLVLVSVKVRYEDEYRKVEFFFFFFFIFHFSMEAEMTALRVGCDLGLFTVLL